ncbi:MAG: hypothetical protein D6805_07340 [Planctomycetota bacterium]|nr:MAG: hypothetical protein D6805_07340 [Planctomycetota bacterium]
MVEREGGRGSFLFLHFILHFILMAIHKSGNRMKKSAEIGLLLGILFPGLGHWYIGKRGKALFFAFVLGGTFLLGFYLCDFGEVAAYDFVRTSDGYHREWRYSFLAQMGIGVLSWVPAAYRKFRNYRDEDPLPEEAERMRVVPSKRLHGLLYMMVAGILNILVAYNAFELLSCGEEAGGGERG